MSVRRSVGYMPDNFGVYDGMKVWEFSTSSPSRTAFRAAGASKSSATCSSC
jgi:hypothetical protein